MHVYRKLASVQEVLEVKPIENADRIEEIKILGWHLVANKGEFNVGDKAVYCEIDSILPVENPNFAFLEGKRIKTKKLRGMYSQGIAFPMSILDKDYPVGTDVTSILGVTKYEADSYNADTPISTPNKWYTKFKLGRYIYRKFFYHPEFISFPEWIHKSDETRVQNCKDIIELYRGITCVVTEKVDGSSTTHWLDDKGNYHICSRNKEILNKNNFMYQAAIEQHIPELLKNLPPEAVVQGEIVGQSIQGNKYKFNNRQFFMFNLTLKGKYVAGYHTIELLKNAGFNTVPVISETYPLDNDIDRIVDMSIGKSALNKDTQREGIVIRPFMRIDIPHDSRFVGGRLSLKAINPKFLVKYDA